MENKTKYNTRKSAKVGKAYAFFDCDASKKQIENSMPNIKRKTRTPEGLQLLLHEGISELQLDNQLIVQINYPGDYRVMSSKRIKQDYEKERRPLASLKYVLEANYRGASNEVTAKELGTVVDNVLRFNKDQGLFRSAVVYEENGEYLLRE